MAKMLVREIAGCICLQAEPKWLQEQLQERNGKMINLARAVRQAIYQEGFVPLSRKEFRQQRKALQSAVNAPTTFVCLSRPKSGGEESKFPALYAEPSGWSDHSCLSPSTWPHKALFVVKGG
ncbi:MAG: hypothetical protein UW71_C0004G0010 [Parcubacteria group bacterium GW2011_GWB1_44_7]|nr:MAG: hypothetical protein UW71_C0004G0010 [Parcubacteria group bacterium GW2011_GWB1_44_7]